MIQTGDQDNNRIARVSPSPAGARNGGSDGWTTALPPPDAFGPDYLAHEMIVAVSDLIKCPLEHYTAMMVLEMQLAASALTAQLKRLERRG